MQIFTDLVQKDIEMVFRMMMRMLVLLPLAVMLGACAVPLGARYDAPMDVMNDQPYVLGAGDTVKVVVYGEDSISAEYLIDQRGMIILPMMGEFPAAGYTEAELQEYIRQAYVQGGYLARPLVTVDATTVQPIAIIGEVRTPGNYAYRPQYNVLKVIAQAGGYTPRAAKNRVLVERWVEGKLVRMNARENTPVLPGDSLIVRERIF